MPNLSKRDSLPLSVQGASEQWHLRVTRNLDGESFECLGNLIEKQTRSLEAAERLKPAGKIIDTKAIKHSTDKASPQEAQAEDTEAGRQRLLKHIMEATRGDIYSYKHAALVLRITARTVRDWVAKGKLDKVEGRSMITGKSIRRCLRAKRARRD
jgi:hypothetical protein